MNNPIASRNHLRTHVGHPSATDAHALPSRRNARLAWVWHRVSAAILMMLSRASRLVVALSVMFASTLAQSQSYPLKPIHFIVPYPPGGAADVVARIVAEGMKG